MIDDEDKKCYSCKHLLINGDYGDYYYGCNKGRDNCDGYYESKEICPDWEYDGEW